MNTSQSKAEHARARTHFPGGVNSPVRAFKSVGGSPLFIARGEGAHLIDVDGNRFIDYVGSWGPLLAGHAHPAIVKAITEAAAHGTSFGAPSPRESELAERVKRLVPSLERLRFVSSGTEAVSAAIRVARGFMGRERIAKFEGCYHGAFDAMLVKAGSGVATLGLPDSPGVPKALAELTSVLPFNDVEALRSFLRSDKGRETACVVIEPAIGNMGLIPPKPGFLEALREECTRAGALLIFDEVMTGFRVAPGGMQALSGVTPDMTCLGKVIGGGLPVGAYGGRGDVMGQVAPDGPIYQAGTLSGNPLAMAAGCAMLDLVLEGDAFARAEAAAAMLCDSLTKMFAKASRPARVQRLGTMFTVFLTATEVVDAATARSSDTAAFATLHRSLLERGVYLPPSPFEAAFTSSVHGEAEVSQTLAAFEGALASQA